MLVFYQFRGGGVYPDQYIFVFFLNKTFRGGGTPLLVKDQYISDIYFRLSLESSKKAFLSPPFFSGSLCLIWRLSFPLYPTTPPPPVWRNNWTAPKRETPGKIFFLDTQQNKNCSWVTGPTWERTMDARFHHNFVFWVFSSSKNV